MSNGIEGNAAIESEASVLFGGLMAVGFGLVAVMAAIGLGWAAAAALGIVLPLVAWKVPASSSARVLPYVLVGLGVTSLLGALFDLLV